MWSWWTVLVSTPAQAQQLQCPQHYALVQFHEFLDAVDHEYTSLQFARARTLLELGQPNVPCIDQVVPSADLARYAIRRAYALALDLDENEAQRWATAAFAIDPTVQWPAYVPAEHSARRMLDDLEPVLPVTLDQGLVIPFGGGVFLDGRFLVEPVAEPAVPHLLQVGDGTGQIVRSGWQDGATFPEDLLGPKLPLPPELPKWYGADGKIRKTARPWTDTRMHRLESSAGFAIVGGTLFASAFLARSAYEERPTDGLYYTVDGAVIASGAASGTALVLLGAALFGK